LERISKCIFVFLTTLLEKLLKKIYYKINLRFYEMKKKTIKKDWFFKISMEGILDEKNNINLNLSSQIEGL